MLRKNTHLTVVDFAGWDNVDTTLSTRAKQQSLKLTDILLWSFADTPDWFWHRELVPVPTGAKIVVCWEADQC